MTNQANANQSDFEKDLEIARANQINPNVIGEMVFLHQRLNALGESPNGCDLDTLQTQIGEGVLSWDRYFELKFTPNDLTFSALVGEYRRLIHERLTVNE